MEDTVKSIPKPQRRGRKPRRRIPPISERQRKVLAMDRVWRAAVARRAGGRCEYHARPVYCDGPLDPHHVRTKASAPGLRHRPENGVYLCRLAHDWAHAHPLVFREWFRDRRPDDWREIS